jgi:hypothetical protein
MSYSSNSGEKSWAESGGPFFPTTSEIGFLEAAQSDVVDTFFAWLTSLGQCPVRTHVPGGLDEGIRSLFPLTTVDVRRYVFFDMGTWTAFFDNSARGTDASPVAAYLARTMACRGLRVVATPDGGGSYGATIFELYGPTPTDFLNYIRTISAANDGGRWRFDVSGTPQPFEDESAYERRRIKDRFTPSMLAEYLRALGVSAFNPSTYLAPILVERMDAEPKNVERLSLEQARARFTA